VALGGRLPIVSLSDFARARGEPTRIDREREHIRRDRLAFDASETNVGQLENQQRAFDNIRGRSMKAYSRILAALAFIAAIAPSQVQAKGCIKGAIIGGIAGHMAGHGKLGAAEGCVVGHHEANKPQPSQEGRPTNPPK
jgi:hypothetical protein